MQPTMGEITLVSNIGSYASKTASWYAIDWQTIEQTVKRLQIRIVKAYKAGNYRKVKSLQWLLTHSFSAKALAVRKVTENNGKNTPGIDKRLWNNPLDKFKAINELQTSGYHPSPLRRVCIPKNNGKTRKLGIPTMLDRATQALYLLALEPIAETTADINSYGFRPQRSCADAIEQCFIVLAGRNSAGWILEADIKSCFDTISHQWIKENIPISKRVLGKWLKSGIIDGKTFLKTTKGVPQGGVISPTIANMTLDGLEQFIGTQFKSKYQNPHKVHFIRYADDFVVTAKDKETLEAIKQYIVAFLAKRGLILSETKTKITHIKEGFDFLSQNVRKYNGKLLITPSKKSIQTIKKKIDVTIDKNQTRSPLLLIGKLNPILRGWANYHKGIVASKTFGDIHSYLFKKLWQWAKRRHPNKSKYWIKAKYFVEVKNSKWNFFAKINERIITIFNISKVKIERHIKIRGKAHLYDPKWETYFEERNDSKMLKNLSTKLKNIWKSQNGNCPVCACKIIYERKWHTHHIKYKCNGGSNHIDNLVMLHPDCHKRVHSQNLTVVKPVSITKS